MTALSAYQEDGSTVAQIQSLARASEPIYGVGFRLFGSTQQEQIWTHVLSSLATRFGVREQVEPEKICFDPKLHWFRIGNVWHNASLRSIIYTVAAQGRKIGGLIQRRS